nr:metal ABC transporter permease [Peptoniphilus stercorisuis]
MIESLYVLIMTSMACALIGSFLMLRKLSMVSDAISHSVLLGIVLAYFITKDITSPFLIIGAALFGVFTVFAIEMLSSTGLVKSDDAVGIVFPLFFSIAVILITKYARNVHLDTDMVLMGEVIMSPLNRINILGLSVPKSLFQMSIMFLLNLIFVVVFFKELKISTFDEEFATIAGFSATILFYTLMTLSSLTAVVAFEAVGAILVVSFLITPAASAYLITKDLKNMLIATLLYSLVNSILGYYLSLYFNVSMSGMTAVIAGITFFLTFMFNRKGLITSIILSRKRKEQFKMELMLMHIGNHMGETDESKELGINTIKDHLNWSEEELKKVASKLINQGIVYRYNELETYRLTKKGFEKYEKIKFIYGM